MSKCQYISEYYTIKPTNIGSDADLMKNIVRSLSLNGTYPEEKANEYIETLTPQFTVPIVIASLCLVGAIAGSCASCFRYKNKIIGKTFSRYFYLVNILTMVVTIFLSIYFAASTMNSVLNGSCQFENSRIKADTLVSDLYNTTVNITDSLDSLVTKVLGSLGDKKPSITMNEYTDALDNLYDYASDTPSCLLPECTVVFDLSGSRPGIYTCSLCLNAQPVTLVSQFIQSSVQPPVEENEKFLDSIDTEFVKAKDMIADGLNSITDIKRSSLSENGAWKDASNLMIDNSYDARNMVWVLFFGFSLIYISIFTSIDPEDSINYTRQNVISWCSCINIIILLSICAVLLPFTSVSKDVCYVLDDIPKNTTDYISVSEDILEVVQKCFGDGKLPQKYLDDLSFVDDIGDCPDYDLSVIFDNIPTGTLRSVVDSMNSFTQSEIDAQTNAEYKQRMIDIMQIKSLAQITYDKEEELKDTVGNSIITVQEVCQDITPLFTLVKNSIYEFSCSDVGSIYYSTLESICVDTGNNILAMLYSTFLLCAFAILFVVGAFTYFVTEDMYAYQSLSRTERF